MQNKAKCKLCESIIQSYHATDYVECSCGQISVSGGDAMYCAAKDFRNFLRVDDLGNVIVPKIVSDDDEPKEKPIESALDVLKGLLKSYEELPPAAMSAPCTNYDLLSVLLVLSALFKERE